MSCASLKSLEAGYIPREELKGKLKTPFEGTQLVDITAEASVSVVISRTKILRANANQQVMTLLQHSNRAGRF